MTAPTHVGSMTLMQRPFERVCCCALLFKQPQVMMLFSVIKCYSMSPPAPSPLRKHPTMRYESQTAIVAAAESLSDRHWSHTLRYYPATRATDALRAPA